MRIYHIDRDPDLTLKQQLAIIANQYENFHYIGVIQIHGIRSITIMADEKPVPVSVPENI